MFKIEKKTPVILPDAVEAASTLEEQIGEIMNGKRKAAHLSVEAICTLIVFIRQKVEV